MAQSKENRSIAPIAKEAFGLGGGFAKGNKLGLLDIPELQAKTVIDIHRIQRCCRGDWSSSIPAIASGKR